MSSIISISLHSLWFSRKEEEIYQSQVNIENIKKYASELQAFLGLKQIQGISMKNENYLQSLEEDGNLKQTKLSFKAVLSIHVTSCRMCGPMLIVKSIDPSLCNTMTSPGQ
jgi:serine kinase of HPr protein (carbohydrate metabolism regulator)